MHGSRGGAQMTLFVIVLGVVLCSAGAVDRQKAKPRTGASGWKSLEVYGVSDVGMDFWLFDPKGGSAWKQSPNLSSTIPDCKIATSDGTVEPTDSSGKPQEGVLFSVSNPAAGVWRVRAMLSESADTALGEVDATLKGDDKPVRYAETSFRLAPGESLQWRLEVLSPGSKDKFRLVRELGQGRED
jgi:hypothetical protein